MAFRNTWVPKTGPMTLLQLSEVGVHGDVFRTDSVLENISVLGERRQNELAFDVLSSVACADRGSAST